MATEITTYLYIILTLLVALCYCIASLRSTYAKGRAERHKRMVNFYMQQIIETTICRELKADEDMESCIESCIESDYHIKARSNSERMALANAIHLIMSHTYATPIDTIRPLVEESNIEKFLLGKLRKSANWQKAQLLIIMSSIPISRHAVKHISRYLYSADRHIRIAALIATLAASPTSAIRTIAELPYTLKPYDTSRIVALLRRGILPIAYEPLLISDNRNLLLLGIAITRSFGIDIADKHLHNIILRNEDKQIAREAIYSLATLGRPLDQQHISELLATMPPTHRRELCHHLSSEGYSLAALRGLFSENEILHAEPLINSYKRDLICQLSN